MIGTDKQPVRALSGAERDDREMLYNFDGIGNMPKTSLPAQFVLQLQNITEHGNAAIAKDQSLVCCLC